MIQNISGLPTGVKADLPFQPIIDDILYAEGGKIIRVNRWQLECYKDFVNESLNLPADYAEGYVNLIIKMLHTPLVWPGFTEEQRRAGIKEMLFDFRFWDYVDANRNPNPSIFVYDTTLNDGRHRFSQFEIGKKGLLATLTEALGYMSRRDYLRGVDYEKTSSINTERDEIIRQMQESARRLIDTGMTQEEVKSILFNDQPKPLWLRITKNFKIRLEKKSSATMVCPEEIIFKTIEIELSPLDKAIYLLYLRHPEGINFSYLPDYREELMEIYKQLMDYRTNAAMRRSIEDVTDPTKNSINEKCARIRRAFSNALGAYQAEEYCITGKRGEVKRIALDRSYVIWDE